MLLFIFLITTALTLDVAKSANSSNTKAPEIPLQPILEVAKTSTVHIEESAAPQYSEGGAVTQKNETKNVVQDPKKVTNKLVTLASVDAEKKASNPMTEALEKDVSSAKSNIKARKGADLATTVNEQLPKLNNSDKNSTAPENPDKLTQIPGVNSTMASPPPTKNTTAAPNLKPTNNQSSAEPVHIKSTEPVHIKFTEPVHIKSTEPVHMKPLILNADESVPVPAEKSEIKKSDSHLRSSSVSAVSGHPNLVVPVTITVFALPLFAVLGYYALKHGREAWKNRHYRRMDFLLDGMYND